MIDVSTSLPFPPSLKSIKSKPKKDWVAPPPDLRPPPGQWAPHAVALPVTPVGLGGTLGSWSRDRPAPLLL